MTVVVVGSEPAEVEPNSVTLDAAALLPMRAATSDTASLLRDVPGVSLYGAGGVSSLPSIRGLADDRLRIKVDGMDLIAACPNHMNPALSYIDPTRVDSIKVYAGITPVSVGGDSIGGTILVESAKPEFAKPGEGVLTQGEFGTFYRSNGDAMGANVDDACRREPERDLYRLDRAVRQLYGRRRLQDDDRDRPASGTRCRSTRSARPPTSRSTMPSVLPCAMTTMCST
jgi:outer membrane receptor protein involved in Fe transport